MSTGQALRIVATEAAVAELGRLRAEHGPLELHLSGGCCDGSSPMCFPSGELRVRDSDVCLGEVAGCPFYIDGEQYERWGSPAFVLDVGKGGGSGFSLEGLHDLHFRIGLPPAEKAAEVLAQRLEPGPLTPFTARTTIRRAAREPAAQVT